MDSGIAVILGASEFPYSPGLAGHPAFKTSAESFASYLIDPEGLSFARERVLNLFDSAEEVASQSQKLVDFLQTFRDATDLFVYYVGHGGFLPHREYFLALRSTRTNLEIYTGLSAQGLAFTLDAIAPPRRFLILDCCFAGEAVREFQSGEVGALVEKSTMNAFARASTSLLVASSKDEPAIAPRDKSLTNFTSALLGVLRNGAPGLGPTLTLREVGLTIRDSMRRNQGGRAVLPEVHSPAQSGEDIASRPLFPNRAYQTPKPKTLPDELLASIDSSLRNIRSGAVKELKLIAAGRDGDLSKLAINALVSISIRDDSLTIRKEVEAALQELSEKSSSHAGFKRVTDSQSAEKIEDSLISTTAAASKRGDELRGAVGEAGVGFFSKHVSRPFRNSILWLWGIVIRRPLVTAVLVIATWIFWQWEKTEPAPAPAPAPAPEPARADETPTTPPPPAPPASEGDKQEKVDDWFKKLPEK